MGVIFVNLGIYMMGLDVRGGVERRRLRAGRCWRGGRRRSGVDTNVGGHPVAGPGAVAAGGQVDASVGAGGRDGEVTSAPLRAVLLKLGG